MYEIKETREGKTRGIHPDLEKARLKAHGLIANGRDQAYVIGDGIDECHETVAQSNCRICNPDVLKGE